ncbi:hypothetical protein [Nannocystis pusilla]|uniref:Uncharacterized protein n=1 Tax=Nannocystis pusilla TaxID=889268 RepID=A0ABS7TQK9_9BACT|nr:hypothetical protein [Nannocystis pusilla]MBZ5710517.1 hypothetical protein [Nannocystis pusilla]
MATLIVTKDSGGAGRSESMTVVPPGSEVPLPALQALGDLAGLKGVVVADLISAQAMHARVSARFACSAAEKSKVGELRKVHQALINIYTSHVAALESLFDELELPRGYVSPGGRVAAFLAQSLGQAPLLAGSVTPEWTELTLLEVALALAERSLADALALAAIAASAQTSSTRSALDKAVTALAAGKATLEGLRELRAHCLAAVAKSKGT